MLKTMSHRTTAKNEEEDIYFKEQVKHEIKMWLDEYVNQTIKCEQSKLKEITNSTIKSFNRVLNTITRQNKHSEQILNKLLKAEDKLNGLESKKKVS